MPPEAASEINEAKSPGKLSAHHLPGLPENKKMNDRPLKILVACEYSGIVSQAFRSKGHHVVSCDLLPSPGQRHHYCGDVRDILYRRWDMLIAFPPCTYLAKAGLHYCINDLNRQWERDKALKFFIQLMEAPIPRIALENPAGYVNSHYRPPDQITSPHRYGSPYSKEICLWLKNLPPLIDTCVSPGLKKVSNHVNSRMSQAQKRHIKSKFFPEMAQAMADQWL